MAIQRAKTAVSDVLDHIFGIKIMINILTFLTLNFGALKNPMLIYLCTSTFATVKS